MRTDVYVRRLHYGLVLYKLAVICLDPSGLCSETNHLSASWLGETRLYRRWHRDTAVPAPIGGWVGCLLLSYIRSTTVHRTARVDGDNG